MCGYGPLKTDWYFGIRVSFIFINHMRVRKFGLLGFVNALYATGIDGIFVRKIRSVLAKCVHFVTPDGDKTGV